MKHNRIKELRLSNNLSQRELENKIHFSQSQIAKWEKNLSEPTLPALVALSKYFNCSIDYIAGNENEEGRIEIAAPELSSDEQELLDGFRQLTPAMKGRILGNMQGLLQAAALTTITGKRKV